MAGPTSPAAEGPSFAPPSLPAGWIAQWDGASKKYYFVQLATGVSQWEVPTEPAQTGSTPAQQIDHPYGTPQPELITHPDGSQTVRHPDGTMEPIMPDGTRGVDGPAGDRGLGTMAMNALLGGKNSSHSGGSSSSPLGSLASQFLGGSHGGSSHSGGGKSSAGKLVGQLASSFMNSNSNKPPQPQNYHGGQTSSQGQHAPPSGGLAGSVMGGVAHMFGGKPSHGNNGQNFGYSHAGHSGGYTGEAPTYHPGGSGGGHPPASAPPAAGNQNYHSPPPSQHTPQHQPQYGVNQHQQPQPQHQNSFPPPPGSMGQPQHQPQHQQQHQQQHNQSYPPPPSGGPMSHGAPQGHQNYPPPPNQQQHGAPQIPGNYPPPPNSYGSQPQYGSPQGGYNPQFNGPSGGQPQYGGQQHQQQQHYGGGAPPVPHGSHPNYGHQPY